MDDTPIFCKINSLKFSKLKFNSVVSANISSFCNGVNCLILFLLKSSMSSNRTFKMNSQGQVNMDGFRFAKFCVLPNFQISSDLSRYPSSVSLREVHRIYQPLRSGRI